MSAIHVTPLDELAEVLEAVRPSHLVRFAAPGKTLPLSVPFDGVRLDLEFHDIAAPRDDLSPPSRQDVERLIAFLRVWPRERPLLLQCWMGVSRSTAAAAIAACVARPDMAAADIAAALRQAAPFATPNPLMIAHADTLLGRNGALTKAIAAIGQGAETGRGRPFMFPLG